MKKTPLSSQPGITSPPCQKTSRQNVVKLQVLVQSGGSVLKCLQERLTKTTGSAGSSFSGFKDMTSSSRSVSGLSQSTLQMPHSLVSIKDRQLKKCHQELEQLRKENSELQAELLFIKSLYKQLIEETSAEKFDERRVTLLKSQVIQLERQILLQSSALQARRDVFLEVENKLLNLKEALR